MRSIYNDYMNNKIKLDRGQKIGILCLLVVLSGVFGWVYEFIFYYFNGGCKEFYMQGGNFLPWINIYAIGAVIIVISTRKFKKKPLYVFLIAMLMTGILEYISGYVIYTFFDGLRLWDYNTEILNFGNIDGYICLRSVLFFGISGLILIYLMFPMCIYLAKRIRKRTFMIISIGIFSIFMFDEIYNLLIARLFNLKRASDIYKELGFKYVNFYKK